MDLETIIFCVAFLGQFGAIVWWASRVSAVQATLALELKEIATGLEEHIRASNQTNLELYRLVERLSAIVEANNAPPRPRVIKGGSS